MRKLVFLLLVLSSCAPAFAVDWHFDATMGINDDSNLESRLDWHVETFYFELDARMTDYADPTIDPAGVSSALKRGCISPTALATLGAFDGLEWNGGLQWRAAVWYRAFDSHGPVANYTRISDLDATYFLGWHFSLGGGE